MSQLEKLKSIFEVSRWSARARQNFGVVQCSRGFLISAGGLFLFVALEKLLYFPWHSGSFATPFKLADPLFSIQTGHIVMATATLGITIAMLSFFAVIFDRSRKLPSGVVIIGPNSHLIAAIIWLAFICLAHRAILWVLGWHYPYAYLFYLINGFGFAQQFAYASTCLAAVYLLVGGMAILQMQHRSSLRKDLKISCHQCGVHIKFSFENLGQKIPCPRCKATIVLRKPDENLKTSCHGPKPLFMQLPALSR